jgi:hypothetical protein
MMGEIIDVRGDVIESYEYDEIEKKSVIKTTQDVEPYLDQNQVERNSQSSGWKGDLHKVATVPLIMIEKWSKELGCNILEKKNRHLLMLKLNDRDYSKLRTKEGRL